MNKPSQVRSYNDNTFREGLGISLIQEPSVDLNSAREKARNICSNIFRNLDEFPYIYFTDGVTGALNYLLSSSPFQVRHKEYRYVFSFPNVNIRDQSSAYFSYPYSATGKFDNLEELCHGRERVVLDCSYLFASNLNCQDKVPNSVFEILFGVSKSHNLFDARVGWFFSRKKHIGFHTLQYDYGYASALSPIVLNNIYDKPINYLYSKYKDKFSELYSTNNLVENDTNLFALDSAGNRVMYYEINKE